MRRVFRFFFSFVEFLKIIVQYVFLRKIPSCE
jgi:hypothetical protein